MRVKEYIAKIRGFAVYPDACTGNLAELMYLALGLGGETGELENKIKKLYRDGDSFEKRYELMKEIGDIFWYLCRLCDVLGVDVELLWAQNVDKLRSRQKRGVLKGSGDNR